MNKLFVTFFLLASSLGAFGQAVLTKAEAVRLATDSNRKVQIAENGILTAEAKYSQTDAIYLPQLSLGYSGVITNSPMNAFGFKLNQKSIAQSDFMPELLNDPDAAKNFSTEASLMLPIFNADMISMRKAAKKQIAIAGFQKATDARLPQTGHADGICPTAIVLRNGSCLAGSTQDAASDLQMDQGSLRSGLCAEI